MIQTLPRACVDRPGIGGAVESNIDRDISFSRDNSRFRHRRTATRIFFVLLYAGSSLFFSCGIYFAHHGNIKWLFLPFVGVPILFFAIVYMAAPKVRAKHIAFDSGGLELKSDVDTKKLNWSEFSHVTVNKVDLSVSFQKGAFDWLGNETPNYVVVTPKNGEGLSSPSFRIYEEFELTVDKLASIIRRGMERQSAGQVAGVPKT